MPANVTHMWIAHIIQNIFEKACAAFSDKPNMTVAVKTHGSDLLTQTKFLTSKRIFKTKDDKDRVNA
jgi:hypothetical protein